MGCRIKGVHPSWLAQKLRRLKHHRCSFILQPFHLTCWNPHPVHAGSAMLDLLLVSQNAGFWCELNVSSPQTGLDVWQLPKLWPQMWSTDTLEVVTYFCRQFKRAASIRR